MAIIDCDILIQAGHENTPDGATGGSGPLGDEIDWTPVVANEAVAILKAAGVNAIKEDASIKHTSRSYRCALAVFVHFDDSANGSSGPSVGYDHDSDADAASAWKALYSEYFPFNDKWRPDNFTEDEHHYYGFTHTFTNDAEFLIEFGDLHSLQQAQWMKPRLRWLGSLLAYFLSNRIGLGTVPKPAPFAENMHLGDLGSDLLKSAALKSDPVLEGVAQGNLVLIATGNRVNGIGPVQDALKLLAGIGEPDLEIDFQGNPNLRGFFGPKTTRAIRAFQKLSGLSETGDVDAETIIALDNAVLALNQPGTIVAPVGGTPGASNAVGLAEPFHTPAASSGNAAGSSKTSGLIGTTQALDDGTLITDATEQLRAIRTDGLNGSLTAHWRKVQAQNSAEVTQENYSYKGRHIPNAVLVSDVTGIGPAPLSGFHATEIKTVKATQFGKNDHEDEGTGSPVMGLIQTNSDVVGASVKQSIMATVFGQDWHHNAKRLGALAEIFHPATRRLVRVPLVDVGPAENTPSHAEVDLTLSCDQFLGTQGLATVSYRILVPLA